MVMRGELVKGLVLVLVGVASGVGAYVFFRVVEALDGLTSAGAVPMAIFAFLSIVIPYIVSRSMGIYSGGGSEVLVKSIHGDPGGFSTGRALGYYASSMLTIGLDGSAGPEGPMILYGAGVTGVFKRIIGGEREEAKKLLLAGAAAGISASFKAPLTGILYALEIPYKRGVEAGAFLWAVPSAIAAYITSQLLIEPHARIEPPGCVVAVDASVILVSVAIGTASAMLALLAVAVMNGLERLGERLGWLLPVLSGALLALLVSISPWVRGLGYEGVNKILNGAIELNAAQLITLALAKTLATSLTVKGGGSGGVFLPTVFAGIALGAGIAELANAMGFNTCRELIISLATASLLAATSKTLLTSIALGVEVFGFTNPIPMLIASTTSYMLTIKWSIIKGQK
jgi:CIC family chloride channel protein